VNDWPGSGTPPPFGLAGPAGPFDPTSTGSGSGYSSGVCPLVFGSGIVTFSWRLCASETAA
jgi:hypothetical protein